MVSGREYLIWLCTLCLIWSFGHSKCSKWSWANGWFDFALLVFEAGACQRYITETGNQMIPSPDTVAIQAGARLLCETQGFRSPHQGKGDWGPACCRWGPGSGERGQRSPRTSCPLGAEARQARDRAARIHPQRISFLRPRIWDTAQNTTSVHPFDS